MAIVKGHTDWKDAMKIEPITSNETETPSRPIYAVSSIEWGAFRDTIAKRDKYWFTGPLREYAAYLFNGYKDSLTWDCKGTLKFTPPCAGCTNCVQKRPEIKTKWSFFMPSTEAANNQPEKENPDCVTQTELCFKTCEFKIQTSNVGKSYELPALSVALGKSKLSYTQFVTEGWQRIKGKSESTEVIPVRTVELLPQDARDGVVIEIDNEEFDVKPIKITLMPKVVKLFCNSELNRV